MREIFKFFEEMGRLYKSTHLCQVEDYLDRMREDNYFALQMFLFNWAYERAGASMGYKIAAVKAVEKCREENQIDIVNKYRTFYPDPTEDETEKHNASKNKKLERAGKRPIDINTPWDVRNERNNPCCDPNINNFLNNNYSISNIMGDIENIQQGQVEIPTTLETIFNQYSSLNGIGDKIASFFLRDMVELILSDYYMEHFNENDYLYLMPVDIWVEKTIENIKRLDGNGDLENVLPVDRIIYRNDKKKFKAAKYLVRSSLHHAVSPLLVNMGIWYFCSIIVQDERRLSNLFMGEDTNQIAIRLSEEKDLMGIFG